MKSYFLAIVAAITLAPSISIAAEASHDFSSAFTACYSATDASNASKSACLTDELNVQSKAVADAQLTTSQVLASSEKQQFADDFVEWKKKILLDCSLLADKQTIAIERENTRKYCLIQQTLARLNTNEEIRLSKTTGK
jgi:hypothetical protein